MKRTLIYRKSHFTRITFSKNHLHLLLRERNDEAHIFRNVSIILAFLLFFLVRIHILEMRWDELRKNEFLEDASKHLLCHDKKNPTFFDDSSSYGMIWRNKRSQSMLNTHSTAHILCVSYFLVLSFFSTFCHSIR